MKTVSCLFLLLSLNTYAQEHCSTANKYIRVHMADEGKRSEQVEGPISLCRKGNTFVLNLGLEIHSYAIKKHELLKSKTVTDIWKTGMTAATIL
jgi:hypothetical protein